MTPVSIGSKPLKNYLTTLFIAMILSKLYLALNELKSEVYHQEGKS